MKSSVNTELLVRILNSSGFLLFLKEYRVMMTLFLATTTLAVLLFLLFNITRLAESRDREEKRRDALNGITVCLFSLALLGGIDTIFGILLVLLFGN